MTSCKLPSWRQPAASCRVEDNQLRASELITTSCELPSWRQPAASCRVEGNFCCELPSWRQLAVSCRVEDNQLRAAELKTTSCELSSWRQDDGTVPKLKIFSIPSRYGTVRVLAIKCSLYWKPRGVEKLAFVRYRSRTLAVDVLLSIVYFAFFKNIQLIFLLNFSWKIAFCLVYCKCFQAPVPVLGQFMPRTH
jgi:hypothetical protein